MIDNCNVDIISMQSLRSKSVVVSVMQPIRKCDRWYALAKAASIIP